MRCTVERSKWELLELEQIEDRTAFLNILSVDDLVDRSKLWGTRSSVRARCSIPLYLELPTGGQNGNVSRRTEQADRQTQRRSISDKTLCCILQIPRVDAATPAWSAPARRSGKGQSWIYEDQRGGNPFLPICNPFRRCSFSKS